MVRGLCGGEYKNAAGLPHENAYPEIEGSPVIRRTREYFTGGTLSLSELPFMSPSLIKIILGKKYNSGEEITM
jgi:hypothetical protein